jgi:hypothetical protein
LFLKPINCKEQGLIAIATENVPPGSYDISYRGGTFAAVTISDEQALIPANTGFYDSLTIATSGCSSIEFPSAQVYALNSPKITVTSISRPTYCGENGTIKLAFENMLDGTYGISHDAGSFADVEVNDLEATISARGGNYTNISTIFNGCISVDNPSTTLLELSSPQIKILSISHPTTCGGEGEIKFELSHVHNATHQIDFDGGAFSGVRVNNGRASVSAAAGSYNNLSITFGSCTSSEFPDAIVMNPAGPDKDWDVRGKAINSGESADFEQSGYEADVTYQLRINGDNTEVGLPISPTGGGSFRFPPVSPTSTTVYNALATNTVTLCKVQLQDTAIITVDGEPLPIELVSFEVHFIDEEHKVKIDWMTSIEIDNDFFTVERSVNGFSWEVLGIVQGAGNSSVKLSYSYYDEDPYMGVSYYRLK